MGLTLTQGNAGPVETAPAGNHRAICCGVIDLGTQIFDYNGESKRVHKLMVRWELSDEPSQADGKPLQISEEFTASLHEKSTLRGFLTAWRGRPFTPEELAGFDPTTLLGQPCLLSVVHEVSKKGKTYAKVKSAGRLAKGMTAPEPVADQVIYQIEDGDPPSELPEWIRKKIDASLERAGKAQARPDPAGAGVATGPVDDDIPY